MENYLGRKLKEYREQHLLTQKQLGDILCVSDKTISKWERGAGLPDIGTLKHLSQLLQIPLDDLLNEKEATLYYEYKSKWMIGWLPILHIVWPNWVEIWRYHRFDPQRNSVFRLLKELPTASGVVSLGIFAKGWFSLGVFSLGIFSAGVCSLGFFSLGMMAGGFVALGNLCIGAMTIGNVSLGMWTVGNLCVGLFCLGNLGIGVVGLGNHMWGQYVYRLPDTAQLKDIQVGIHELSRQMTNLVYQKWILDPVVYILEHPVFLLILIIGFTIVIFVPIASLMHKLVSGRLKFGN